MIVHALKFTDEVTALAQLTEFAFASEDGPVLRRDICDPIGTIYQGNGVFTTDPETGIEVEGQAPAEGWHVNIALPDLRADLPGFVGAWHAGERNEAGEVILLAGVHPTTPARDFAA